MPGSQDFAADPRNEKVLIYLNGALVPRAEAKVSVFDAGFVLGDGVWEGLRLHKGGLLFLEAHLDRLYDGARAIALDIGLSREEMIAALRRTVEANGMESGVHIRLMVTRGPKKAPNQDPRNALGTPTIVIVAEHKEPSEEIVTRGLKLATSSIRCTPKEMFDMRLNSHSRLALIRALLDVIDKGADEALMLDPARLRVELQRDELLLREGRRGSHLDGRVLLQRRHARQRHRAVRKPTASPMQAGEFHARRRARRGRSLRHRHVRRADAGARDRRLHPAAVAAGPGDDEAARAVRGAERRRRGAAHELSRSASRCGRGRATSRPR